MACCLASACSRWRRTKALRSASNCWQTVRRSPGGLGADPRGGLRQAVARVLPVELDFGGLRPGLALGLAREADHEADHTLLQRGQVVGGARPLAALRGSSLGEHDLDAASHSGVGARHDGRTDGDRPAPGAHEALPATRSLEDHGAVEGDRPGALGADHEVRDLRLHDERRVTLDLLDLLELERRAAVAHRRPQVAHGVRRRVEIHQRFRDIEVGARMVPERQRRTEVFDRLREERVLEHLPALFEQRLRLRLLLRAHARSPRLFVRSRVRRPAPCTPATPAPRSTSPPLDHTT